MGTVKEVQDEIQHNMLQFQIGDLRKAITCARANFLVAIGLVVSTEFLGGLITGTLGFGQKDWLPEVKTEKKCSIVEYRFEEGFKYLGAQYAELLNRNKKGVLDVYKNVRCGLVHQYLPKQTEGIYAGHTGGPGVVDIEGKLKIFVDDYIRDLENAVIRLIDSLATHDHLLQNCQQGLERIPKLA